MPTGAPSSRMCADLRRSRQALFRISAATKSDSSGSIGAQPVHTITRAATRGPSRALPRRRALCTNWKKPR